MDDRKRPSPILLLFILLLGLSVVAACGTTSPQTLDAPIPTPTTSSLFAGPETTPASDSMTGAQTEETAVSPQVPQSHSVPIRIDLSAPAMPIDKRVLGTNLPAWLGAGRTEDATFLTRTQAAGTAVIRIPGGSWSNGYDWLACETGQDIEGNASCWSWPGGLRPTDFINFIKAVGAEGMYTVNHNGAALEAAALVAFFNGAVDDDSVIGVDVRGRDWGRVSDWAKLRRDNGNPDPLPIRYWEIGNEIYGGREGMGTDCSAFGWEEVWTCDGREYVLGLGAGNGRREGFLDFQTAMKKVDPTILVGAVGVYPSSDWSDWGNEVIATAGQAMDFYIIHHYAYFDPPSSNAEILAQPQETWGPIMADIETAFDTFANGRRVPIAVTEHNLFSFQDLDNNQWMTRAANMLFMADTIGQMLQNGVAIANQWDLANGLADNGTDYGLLNADTYARSPQYYVFPLWAAFGTEMLPIVSEYDAATALSVYAGRDGEGAISVLAINKTGEPIETTIQFDRDTAVPISGTANIVQTDSLDSQTIAFNGALAPPDNLAEAPPTTLTDLTNPLPYTFPPYSITLLHIVLPNE